MFIPSEIFICFQVGWFPINKENRIKIAKNISYRYIYLSTLEFHLILECVITNYLNVLTAESLAGKLCASACVKHLEDKKEIIELKSNIL